MQPSLKRQVSIGLFILVIVFLVALAGSLATIPNVDGWYRSVQKVAWNPPNELFGPAWSVLYFAMAVAGFLIWRAGYRDDGEPNMAKNVLRVFALQLTLNAIWTPLFFAGYPLIGTVAWYLALVDMAVLIVVVAWLIKLSWRWSKTAALLLFPYLLWITFASTLNLGVIMLNP